MSGNARQRAREMRDGVMPVRTWRERFDASAGQVAAMFDEMFVRAWRLYLAGSEAAFTTGWMQLFQIVFARGDSNAIPWTREG